MDKNAEKKLATLRGSLSQQEKFTVDDACRALGSKRSTALWVLSNLSRAGRIFRVSRGVYTFDENSRPFRVPHLSAEMTAAIGKLQGEGVSFVLTGLDILLPFVQHQPGRILHLIYTGVGAGTWAQSLLKESQFTPVLNPTRQEVEKILDIIPEGSELVILREKSSQSASSNSLATLERAFVDLYVEATREMIPFPVQEVAYIYLNMSAAVSLNTEQMVRYAHDRSIKDEIRQIVNFKKQEPTFGFDKPLTKFLKVLEAIG